MVRFLPIIIGIILSGLLQQQSFLSLQCYSLRAQYLSRDPSDSNIKINLNSVDHNADVRFSPVFQPVVVVFADFSGLISLSEDSFKEVCKTIVGCYVQLVDLFTVLFVAFLVWFLHSSQISGIGVSLTLLKTQLIIYIYIYEIYIYIYMRYIYIYI
ncbi:Hypothetical_protein [Hexamita inflata]|uniref:Hypothetical_protein n=1 Tax=Hexamita inflata TaxID=28002 RepID=A0AA86U476_9EUKA|nr:Hypothetical protein HINF_LOCUS29460 [Hexamita inflata]